MTTVNVSALLGELAARHAQIQAGEPAPSLQALDAILAGADWDDADLLAGLAAAAAAWGDPAAADRLQALASAVRDNPKLNPRQRWVWNPGGFGMTPTGKPKPGSWALE